MKYPLKNTSNVSSGSVHAGGHVFMFVCEGIHDCPSRTNLSGNQDLNWSRKFPQCVSMFITLVSWWADCSRSVYLHCTYISSRQAEHDDGESQLSSETHHHALTGTDTLFPPPLNETHSQHRNAPLLLYMNDRVE